MAESVDALVSNTSGATRAGSTPALGTRKGGFPIPFLVRHSEQGDPPGPLSLAYSLRPNTLYHALRADGTNSMSLVTGCTFIQTFKTRSNIQKACAFSKMFTGSCSPVETDVT